MIRALLNRVPISDKFMEKEGEREKKKFALISIEEEKENLFIIIFFFHLIIIVHFENSKCKINQLINN